MGETLNKFMAAGDALHQGSKTLVAGAGALGMGGAGAIAEWAGAPGAIEGFTEDALSRADEVSSAQLAGMLGEGNEVPSVAPGGQVGAKVQGEFWAIDMPKEVKRVITDGSKPNGEGGPNLTAYTQFIISNVLKCITNSMLTGPVSFAGMGFSVGSPMMHIVIIPFGDAQLNPMNIII